MIALTLVIWRSHSILRSLPWNDLYTAMFAYIDATISLGIC